MLRLRPYKSGDAAYIMSWVADANVHTAWCADRLEWPLDQSVFDRYQQANDRSAESFMMTMTNEAGIPVGYLTMSVRDYALNSVHLSALIVDSSCRGQGLGTKMVELALRYAKEILGVTRATLNVFGHNHAAHAYYRKAGFQETNYIPGAVQHGDELWDRCMMAKEL